MFFSSVVVGSIPLEFPGVVKVLSALLSSNSSGPLFGLLRLERDPHHPRKGLPDAWRGRARLPGPSGTISPRPGGLVGGGAWLRKGCVAVYRVVPVLLITRWRSGDREDEGEAPAFGYLASPTRLQVVGPELLRLAPSAKKGDHARPGLLTAISSSVRGTEYLSALIDCWIPAQPVPSFRSAQESTRRGCRGCDSGEGRADCGGGPVSSLISDRRVCDARTTLQFRRSASL